MNKKTHFPDINGVVHTLPAGVVPLMRLSAYVLVECDERILTVQPTWAQKLDLPGGGLDLGETLAECARREFEEETGYRVKLHSEKSVHYEESNFFYRDVGDSDDSRGYYWHVVAHFFHGTLESKVRDEKLINPNEIREVLWVLLTDFQAGSARKAYLNPYYQTALDIFIAQRSQPVPGGWTHD